MARPRTVSRVHAAVIELATDQGPGGLTMEGIAAQAGVGKQTLYRTWPSVPAILFDALLARGGPTRAQAREAGPHGGTPPGVEPGDPEAAEPNSAPRGAATTGEEISDVAGQLEDLLRAATEEISTEPHASLLRALAAAIQTDEAMAREFHERLLRPQLDQVADLLRRGGFEEAKRAAELLFAPVHYRWSLRLPPMDAAEISWHVSHVLGATTARHDPRRSP